MYLSASVKHAAELELFAMGEISTRLKSLAKFPFTSQGPGFHPLFIFVHFKNPAKYVCSKHLQFSSLWPE